MVDCVFQTLPLLPVKEKKSSCMILHNFINSLVFIDIKKTLHYKVGIE